MPTVNLGSPKAGSREILVDLPDNVEKVSVTLKASTSKGGEKREEEFNTEVPKSLGDAIVEFGRDKVFRLFFSALAIQIQGDKRKELVPEEKREKRATAYLDQLGF